MAPRHSQHCMGGARHDRGAVAVLVLCLSLSASGPANAYLDPGTGTMLLQGIIAAIGGAIAYVYLFAARLRQFFSRLVRRQGRTDEPAERDADANR